VGVYENKLQKKFFEPYGQQEQGERDRDEENKCIGKSMNKQGQHEEQGGVKRANVNDPRPEPRAFVIIGKDPKRAKEGNAHEDIHE
jgi:hypothetical protein